MIGIVDSVSVLIFIQPHLYSSVNWYGCREILLDGVCSLSFYQTMSLDDVHLLLLLYLPCPLGMLGQIYMHVVATLRQFHVG